MGIKFPILVYAKDDHSFETVNNDDFLQGQIEIFDVEDNEFLAWDTSGEAVELYVENDKICVRKPPKQKNFLEFLEEINRIIPEKKKSADLENLIFLLRIFRPKN